MRGGAVDPRRAHLRRGLAPSSYRGWPLLRSPGPLPLIDGEGAAFGHRPRGGALLRPAVRAGSVLSLPAVLAVEAAGGWQRVRAVAGRCRIAARAGADPDLQRAACRGARRAVGRRAGLAA